MANGDGNAFMYWLSGLASLLAAAAIIGSVVSYSNDGKQEVRIAAAEKTIEGQTEDIRELTKVTIQTALELRELNRNIKRLADAVERLTEGRK